MGTLLGDIALGFYSVSHTSLRHQALGLHFGQEVERKTLYSLIMKKTGERLRKELIGGLGAGEYNHNTLYMCMILFKSCLCF